MRTAIGLFIAALVCIAIAWWVSLLPGTLTATLGGTTIQTSTPVAATLLAVAFVVLYAIIRLLAWLISIPRRVGSYQTGRTRLRGETAINRALIALAANDAGAARREADRGRRLLGDTPLTLLLAAQAGKQAGRDDEAAALYEQLAERSDAKLLGLRGLIRLAVERQDWEAATRLASQAEKAHPNAKWLRDERRHMALQTGEWGEALKLAGPEHKAALALAAAEQASDPKAAMALAKQAFEADPGLPPASIEYAKRLRESGRQKQAQDVLRQAWSACPHPDIADAFVEGIADKGDRARELAVLVRANPDNAESAIAVARAAIDAGMIGEARRQLERARDAGVNQRRLWTLMADVDVLDGKTDAAQEALRQLKEAGPNPVWRCSACGTQHERWHPLCTTCHSTGTIVWTQPGDAVPARLRAALPQPLDGLAT